LNILRGDAENLLLKALNMFTRLRAVMKAFTGKILPDSGAAGGI
jgi:hypothetical protein